MREIKIGFACFLLVGFTLGIVIGPSGASAEEPANPVSKNKPQWIENPEDFLKERNLSPEAYKVAVGSAMAHGSNKRFSRKIAEMNAKKQLAIQLHPKDVERSSDGSSLSITTILRGVRTLATWESPEGEFYVLVVGPREPAEAP